MEIEKTAFPSKMFHSRDRNSPNRDPPLRQLKKSVKRPIGTSFGFRLQYEIERLGDVIWGHI